MSQTSFPTFQTERLVLRQIVAADINRVFEGLSDQRVIRFYGVSYRTPAETREQMEWYEKIWREQTGGWWAVAWKEYSNMIGACGLNNISLVHRRAELGYWLLPVYWGKGIMSEVLPLVIGYAFHELKLHRLEAFVEVENINSTRLLEKMAFKQEGTLEDFEWKDDRFISLHVFARLNRHHP